MVDSQRQNISQMYQTHNQSPTKKRRSNGKSSPMKSPLKKKNKENDENFSPVKTSSFSSPTKASKDDQKQESAQKENRMS